MEDPFLNYFALGLLFFVIIVMVYGIIAIHDIRTRTPSPAPGCDPCRRLDQPVHAAPIVAVPLDLGDDVSAGSGLGFQSQGKRTGLTPGGCG
jgi:hypothetical protein